MFTPEFGLLETVFLICCKQYSISNDKGMPLSLDAKCFISCNDEALSQLAKTLLCINPNVCSTTMSLFVIFKQRHEPAKVFAICKNLIGNHFEGKRYEFNLFGI